MKVILGAGGTTQVGWMSLEQTQLDITRYENFYAVFKQPASVDAFLAEHVWEHLGVDEAVKASRNCYSFLKPGGRLRIAVPDGFHVDPHYLEWVRPGGVGPGADDHRRLFVHATLTDLLRSVGFDEVRLVEWWDAYGVFNFRPWSPEDGFVRRSIRYDQRNSSWNLPYTSLIVDGIKRPG